MLTVYFDESYTHPPTPLVYTIAGYISSNDEWRRFQKEWKRELERTGLGFFHMAKYESRHGEYREWNNEKRVNVIRRLHRTIKRRVLRSFAAAIVIKDFDEIITPEIREGFGEPHLFGIIACMKHIRNWANKNNYVEPISYVFESGTKYDATIERVCTNISRNEEQRTQYRLGSWSIKDKRVSSPLQAADILAYEVTKELSRRLSDHNARPIRQSIKNLSMPEVDEWFRYDREQLLKILSFVVENKMLEVPPEHPVHVPHNLN